MKAFKNESCWTIYGKVTIRESEIGGQHEEVTTNWLHTISNVSGMW